MPFAYLRKQREAEERQRQRALRLGQNLPRDTTHAATSPYRALKIALISILLAPVLLNIPWLHSALGPGKRLPDLWVRPTSRTEEPTCWNVEGGKDFRYCEDIHHIPGTEEVLVSCDASRAGWNTVMGLLADPIPRGGLFTFSYPTSASPSESRKVAMPVKLINFPDEVEFHPLGLATIASGEMRKLFVVNHRRLRSSVELFDLNPTTDGGWEATWQRSIVHPLATHTPNSIHALSEHSFVVTNDHLFARRPGPIGSHMVPLLTQLLPGSHTGVGRWIVEYFAKIISQLGAAGILAQVETLLGLPLGWVTYVEFSDEGKEGEGVKAKLLARGIPFANGLVVTPDEKTLVVASTTYPGVFIYDVLPPHPHSRVSSLGGDSTLRLNTKLHLPFRVDNLALTHPSSSLKTFSSSDRFSGHQVLATGHPAPLKLISMARNPLTKVSPSWSVSITPYTPTPNFNANPGTGLGEGEKWEDHEAPLPAHHFTLSHNAGWRIRTLMQSQGAEVDYRGEKVGLPSSASSFYAPSEVGEGKGEGGEGGTLLVSGLYGSVMACTNVGT